MKMFISYYSLAGPLHLYIRCGSQNQTAKYKQQTDIFLTFFLLWYR